MGTQVAGPFMPGKLNTQLTPVWHRRAFAAAAVLGPTVTFFGEVAGVNGVGPELTNMTRAFELEAPREVTVTAMRISIYDTGSADVYKLMKSYTAQLIVAGNTLLNAPIDCFPAASGLYGSGVQNGNPDPKAVSGLLPYAIKIPAGVGFSVQLVGTSVTVTAAAFIGVFLDGPFSKPVS